MPSDIKGVIFFGVATRVLNFVSVHKLFHLYRVQYMSIEEF